MLLSRHIMRFLVLWSDLRDRTGDALRGAPGSAITAGGPVLVIAATVAIAVCIPTVQAFGQGPCPRLCPSGVLVPDLRVSA